MIQMDIDNFSSFNNRFEDHQMGDLVLKHIANHMLAHADQESRCLAFRTGGDEFVVLVKGGLEDGRELAEEFRESVRILLKDITLSIGVSVRQEGDTKYSWKKRCEMLLYSSKKRGKNCVTGDGDVDENSTESQTIYSKAKEPP